MSGKRTKFLRKRFTRRFLRAPRKPELRFYKRVWMLYLSGQIKPQKGTTA